MIVELRVSPAYCIFGVNLYSQEQTLIEQYGIEYINKELSKKSDFMYSLVKESK